MFECKFCFCSFSFSREHFGFQVTNLMQLIQQTLRNQATQVHRVREIILSENAVEATLENSQVKLCIDLFLAFIFTFEFFLSVKVHSVTFGFGVFFFC